MATSPPGFGQLSTAVCWRWRFAAVVWFAWTALKPLLAPAADDLFFESRIRPILVHHCQECHSQAEGKTSGGLALDSRQGWQEGGNQGPAIVPGRPEESLLIRAIRHEPSVAPMPPEDSLRPLTEQQKQDLEEWIRQGAFDPRIAAARIGGMPVETAASWWSLQPVLRSTPPQGVDERWVYNDIDRFVVAQLSQHNLKPNRVADRRTWLRRVTFDLTGLPPTPDEIRAFLSDSASDAYERVVDRLLASPAYGERYGRHWLDVVRYADTAGDGSDYPVPEAVKYRDWVIESFNKNVAWDEFLRQQIAGDIYAKEDPADDYANKIIATGYLAIGKRYGYDTSPAFEHLDFADAIDSIGRSVLGLSLGCARCHDHKYDPVTMEDYYAWYGIMKSTKWAFPGGEMQQRPANFPPLVPAEEAQRREEEKAERLRQFTLRERVLTASLARCDPALIGGGPDLDFEHQEVGTPPADPWLSAGPNEVAPIAQSPFGHGFGAGSRGVRVGARLAHEGVRYQFGEALRDPPSGHYYLGIDFRTLAESDVSEASSPDESGSYRFYWGHGVLESTAVECSVTPTELAVRESGQWRVIARLETNKWYSLRIAIDLHHRRMRGSLHADQIRVEFGPFNMPPDWDGVADTFFNDGAGHWSGNPPVRDLDNLVMQSFPFPDFEAGLVRDTEPTPEIEQQLARGREELATMRTEREQFAAARPYEVAYAVSEGTPGNARIHRSGEPQKLGAEVPRRFLEILGGNEVARPEQESGRRDLAEWLTDPANPLTPRVWVNRVWHWHFGRGLVATTSDFGIRGDLPTHPKLLDWLTRRFVESGWDVKALHRDIVLSRTYRLSSVSDPNNPARLVDPENHWLWRQNLRPLEAEALRDAMLFVSGKLDTSQPQRHPFPPVNTWAFTIHHPFHAVYESNHRSVYLMIQRNLRHPYLTLFDAADPNVSMAERTTTITPVQSLYLMNSPEVDQCATALGERLSTYSADPVECLQNAYELVLGQQAQPDDIQRGLDFLQGYQAATKSDSAATAWAALARVLITSNPFLYVE